MQNAKAGAHEENAAEHGNFAHQGRCHIGRNEACKKINAALPAKEHQRSDGNAEAVGRGQDNAGNKVQCCIGKKISVVAVKTTFDGTKDGQGADAKEQDGGGKALGQLGAALGLLQQAVEAAVQVQTRADDGAHGDAGDKKHGVGDLGDVADEGVGAEANCGEAKAVKESSLIFFLNAATNKAADYGASQNAANIYYCT